VSQADTRKPDTPGAVRDWLRDHPGEAAFTTQDIRDAFAPGRRLHTTAISAELAKCSQDGSYPTLARTGKSTWTLTKSPPRDGEYRIIRDLPLKTGARLEVVGMTGSGRVVVARDPSGRLWVVTPLELPA
jgi:hypothetical protein